MSTEDAKESENSEKWPLFDLICQQDTPPWLSLRDTMISLLQFVYKAKGAEIHFETDYIHLFDANEAQKIPIGPSFEAEIDARYSLVHLMQQQLVGSAAIVSSIADRMEPWANAEWRALDPSWWFFDETPGSYYGRDVPRELARNWFQHFDWEQNAILRGTIGETEIGGLNKATKIAKPVMIDAAGLLRHVPGLFDQPASPSRMNYSYRSGFPGRPTAKHILLDYALKCLSNGTSATSLAEFAGQLQSWLVSAHPDAPSATIGTIENAVRDLWNSHKATK